MCSPKYEGRGVGLGGWAEVEGMGMMRVVKKTGHSIGRCHTLIRLQCSQQYQLQ